MLIGKYEITGEEAERLRRRFSYHAPKEDQQIRYLTIRDKGLEFAFVVAREVPPGRQREEAINRIEQAVMWANAGIAQNE